MNGHISSCELEGFFDWLPTPEDTRKPAVLNWTSGLARQLGYIVEKYYKQKKKPDYPHYDEVFQPNHLCVGIARYRSVSSKQDCWVGIRSFK